MPGADRPDPARAASTEAETLRRLFERSVAVPRLIALDGDTLTLEYIAGTTLTEAIEFCESGAPPPGVSSLTAAGEWAANATGTSAPPLSATPPILLAEGLARLTALWFGAFYAAAPAGARRGDVNCRNFILTPAGGLYGVDFESLPAGDKETDLGRLTAYILTYEPPYTIFKKRLSAALTDAFTDMFGADRGLSLREQAAELDAMRLRRR